MNVGLHHFAERVENQAVPLDSGQPGKLSRNHSEPEVSAAVAGPCMSGMEVAFVIDLEEVRSEGGPEQGFHPVDTGLVHQQILMSSGGSR